MDKHTPLPWRFYAENTTDRGHYQEPEIYGEGDWAAPKIVCTVATRAEAEANGKQIVLAVNNHQRLVDALRNICDALRLLEDSKGIAISHKELMELTSQARSVLADVERG